MHSLHAASCRLLFRPTAIPKLGFIAFLAIAIVSEPITGIAEFRRVKSTHIVLRMISALYMRIK